MPIDILQAFVLYINTIEKLISKDTRLHVNCGMHATWILNIC